MEGLQGQRLELLKRWWVLPVVSTVRPETTFEPAETWPKFSKRWWVSPRQYRSHSGNRRPERSVPTQHHRKVPETVVGGQPVPDTAVWSRLRSQQTPKTDAGGHPRPCTVCTKLLKRWWVCSCSAVLPNRGPDYSTRNCSNSGCRAGQKGHRRQTLAANRLDPTRLLSVNGLSSPEAGSLRARVERSVVWLRPRRYCSRN